MLGMDNTRIQDIGQGSAISQVQQTRFNRGLARKNRLPLAAASVCGQSRSRCIRSKTVYRQSRHICRAESIDVEAEKVESPNADQTVSESKDGEIVEDDVEDDVEEYDEEGEGEEGEEGEEEEQMTEEEFEFLMDQPSPSNLQQTLFKSFVLEAICQHGGHQACVKVKPAYAGEGKYFVVVPFDSIPPPEEISPDTEAKMKAYMDAQEAEEAGQTPSGKSSEELEAELAVDIQPDELTAKGADEDVLVPSLDTASIIPEEAMFLTFEQGENRIINAETLLAALEAGGIDNCRIEIEAKEDGSKPLEVPCPDGSATVWADFIKFAGLRFAPSQDGTEHVPKKRIIPQKVISVRDGDSFIQLIPSKNQERRISVGLNLTQEAPIVGSGWTTWSPEDVFQQHWRWMIAPARPFIVSPQVGQAMQAEGYYKGAGDESVAVANFTEWNNEEFKRFDDEPIRRNLQEFVADLSLLSQNGSGGFPEGHIIAFDASRELQLRFLRAVAKNSEIIDDSSEVPQYAEEEAEAEGEGAAQAETAAAQ